MSVVSCHELTNIMPWIGDWIKERENWNAVIIYWNAVIIYWNAVIIYWNKELENWNAILFKTEKDAEINQRPFGFIG